jgi:diguanylate cyclase (GGDEF)-like protein/PAS domain S-box-containing protein
VERTFEKLLSYSFDILAILDIDGNFKFVNRAFSEKLGWTSHELTGRNLQEVIILKEQETSSNMLKSLSRGHPILFSECQFKHQNNSLYPIHLTAYPDLDELCIFLVIHDSNTKMTEQEIFKMAIEASPTVIFIVKNGKFLYANLLAEKVFGYKQDEFIGRSLEMLVPSRLHKAHQGHYNRYSQQPYTRLMGTSLELPGVRKNGTEIILDIGLNPVYSLDGLMVVCSIIDVTKRKEAENTVAQKIQLLESEIVMLDKLSLTDELTSLFNRRALFKHLELHYRIAQKESLSLSFILADIDDFKGYNDAFGHLAGDEVLKLLANAMKTSFRRTDIICRYGGEEIAVILPSTDAKEARIMGERLRKDIEEFKWLNRGITISIGVATISPRINQTASLGAINNIISMADIALYLSKRSGKNKATHYHDVEGDSQKQISAWRLQHDTPADH